MDEHQSRGVHEAGQVVQVVHQDALLVEHELLEHVLVRDVVCLPYVEAEHGIASPLAQPLGHIFGLVAADADPVDVVGECVDLILVPSRLERFELFLLVSEAAVVAADVVRPRPCLG